MARRGVSIALACRTFGVSETCFRYGPKLRAENEEIADLLVGLTAYSTEEGHLFHAIAGTHSTASRAAIPREGGQVV